jgi:type II secretory pathway pseudopilin PulG
MRNRSENGSYLIETLIACLIGSVLLLATFTQVTAMYKQGTTNENQIIATNMAQQLIDNARNSTWGDLSAIADTGWQTVPLYTVPNTPASVLFPRPLLRNPNLTYSAAASGQLFNGQAQERLVTVNNAAGTVLRLEVDITWSDSKGTGHEYQTQTIISATGIHN